jgi:UDP-glucose 4-epimerase
MALRSKGSGAMAGYIGSHACKTLSRAGFMPVAYDNMSRGNASVPVRHGPRWPADPPAVVADPVRASAILGWHPQHPEIEAIAHTAWRWHSRERPQGAG